MPVSRIWTGRERAKLGRRARIGSYGRPSLQRGKQHILENYKENQTCSVAFNAAANTAVRQQFKRMKGFKVMTWTRDGSTIACLHPDYHDL